MGKDKKKIDLLDDIKAEALRCDKCDLCNERTNVVFGEGDIHTKLMFIGEGPGYEEDKSARPFVGRSGKKLNKWIAQLGLSRQDVYITNIVKCRPPNNRDPKPEESYRCTAFYLHRQIELINPKAICTLGRPATQALLATDERITKLVNKPVDGFNRKILPLFHPAYILRNPIMQKKVDEGLKVLKTLL